MKVGSIVMFTNSSLHVLNAGEFYPPVKTMGTVLKVDDICEDVFVQWPAGSTSKDDCWWCGMEDVLEL